jgi:hypothetical protein
LAVLAADVVWALALAEATAPDTNDRHNYNCTYVAHFWCKTNHPGSKYQQRSPHHGSTNLAVSEALAPVAALAWALAAKALVEDKEPTSQQ